MDAKLAWYSVGSSTHLDSGCSSYSLLQSIYGSQASQLPFSDYESEASLVGTQSDHHVHQRASPNVSRRLTRPKSSPANVISAREQLRSNPSAAPARPGSALNRKQRPGSAATRLARGRPSSARPVQRPASAASVVRGGASPSRRRPKTAMGFQRHNSLSGSTSSAVLLDLEEEDEEGEDVVAPIIRDTAPVRLTHTPEYFDFWQGKPLRVRDYGVKVQKRKAWQRPKSDYGNRFFTRNKNKENDDGKGGRGDGDDDGLGVLLEKDSDSALGSRRGSKDFGSGGDGGFNDGKDKSGGDQDLSKLSVSGEGVGSRSGSKDFGGKRNKKSLRDRSTSSTGSRNKSGMDRNGSDKTKKSGWGDQDGQNAADDDDYFKNSCGGCGSDGGENVALLPIISNTNLTTDSPTDYDHHNNDERMQAAEKENQRPPVNDIHSQRERRGMKQLRPVERLPCIVAPDDGYGSGYDYDSGKALAAVSWMDGGGSGSGNTTRFELPMDMKTLEGMSPLKYLGTHCIISKRRMAHCSKVFTKLDTDRDSRLSVEEITVGLVQVHHNCITSEQATSVVDLTQMTNDVTVNCKLFAAICCLAERMLNLFYLPIARKEVIETVDFEALDWKLRTCTIDEPLRMLFSQL